MEEPVFRDSTDVIGAAQSRVRDLFEPELSNTTTPTV